MLKAEALLKFVSDVKPGKYITWPVYDGEDILEAKEIEEYLNTFFKTGIHMPFPPPYNLCLDIYSVEVVYDDVKHTHKIIIEGFVMKRKENHHANNKSS